MTTIKQNSRITDIVVVEYGDIELQQDGDCIVIFKECRLDVCRALLPENYEIREKEVQGE